MINAFPVGILFSVTGSYGTVSRSMRNGAMLACDQINSNREFGVTLLPIACDPGGDALAYAPAAEAMIANGVKNVVGCYTSSSRKEVIPVFEKRDALLWYPTHYEGFESSANVIYTGASPNHHMLPLVDYVTRHVGRRIFCVGSNYIWAWESNRVLREELALRQGSVVGERYLAVGETDVDFLVQSILDADPDVVFNSLIGESAYTFFRAFRAACEARGIDQAKRYPVASCNLSEPELDRIGPGAIDGHLSSSVYFASIDTVRNRQFVSDYCAAFPEEKAPSAEAEAAYVAMFLLAQSLRDAGTDNMRAVKTCAARQHLNAPQGDVTIDPGTFHTYLTPRIGLSRRDGHFDVLFDAASPIAPDPYLIHSTAIREAPSRRPALRIVS
ncbi:transporter substrate-binding domain-containing protein [Rhizobium skierniewicense]|uniref:transporter substrate-binding domain-containing protein n=1 Tax=Rhizobium skierniewicense TaxID=984260 RepID=UPI001572C0AC|nr:transporter substrate-binding domain-containing protein [Rhizobium skierniewicense]NTF33868.1 transporter substrate-binding domain-containing protein [Rhizobium skierniewicense]